MIKLKLLSQHFCNIQEVNIAIIESTLREKGKLFGAGFIFAGSILFWALLLVFVFISGLGEVSYNFDGLKEGTLSS